MKPHAWIKREVDGGPAGANDFWWCPACGASGGGAYCDPKPFLAGPAIPLSDDCDVARRQIREHAERGRTVASRMTPGWTLSVTDAMTLQGMGQRLERIEALVSRLVRKLDVVLPKASGVIAFQTVRTGQQAYDGPVIGAELDELRRMLGLPKPSAKEQDFWPADYCKRCHGTGEVVAGEGSVPWLAAQGMKLHVANIPENTIEEAYRILRETDPSLSAVKARDMIKRLPDIPIFLHDCTTIEPRGPERTRKFAQIGASFLWIRPVVFPMVDVCPDCRGTANRGLPLQKPYPLGPDAPVQIEWRHVSRHEIDGDRTYTPEELQEWYDRRHGLGQFAEEHG